MPLAALLVLCLSAAPAPQLQPKTYASPSGGWELRVAPKTREGTGEADYTLSGSGREAWTRRHPFAMWEAAVTDDGRVAGFAYVGSTPEAPGGGSLHVVLLSPAGEVLLDEAHERKWSRFPHQPATPTARGLFVQPELGRFVVRFDDEDLNRGAEEWRAYDLARGTPLFQERPKLALEQADGIRWMLAARAIPGTPLVLVNWYRFASEVKPWSLGGVFQVLDAERRQVWRLDLPHDYEVSGDAEEQDRLRSEIWKESAILTTGPRRFELRHVAESLRVAYALEEGTDGTWTVREVAHEPHGPSVTPPPASAEPLRLTLSREVALGGAVPPPAEIRDVLAFGFDAEGRLRFARRDGADTTLVRLSEAGEVRLATRVALELDAEERLSWTPLSGSAWLAVASRSDPGTRARAWRVEEGTGALTQLADFPGQDVDQVVELADGHLLVLSTWHFPFTTTSTLSACTPQGTTLWTVEENLEDPDELFAPRDFTVTSTGEVVVLDIVRKVLQIYTDAGRHVRTIELDEAWGVEPNDPCSIVADREGGVLVQDYGGGLPLVRMSLDGTVRARLDARMADGRPRAEYRNNVRYAPDERLWTTDGHVLVRLDAEGRADREVGSPVRMDWLEAPGPARVDSGFGRCLVLDKRSRALHVFDGEGRRVLLGVPRSEDLEGLRYPLEMVCDSTGGARLAKSRFERSYLSFGSDGASRGLASLEGTSVAFVPGREAYWSVRKGAPVCFGTDGERLREVTKLPDGRWWRSIEDLAVAADGSLVVLDMPRSDGIRREEGRALVARFDAEGQPLGLHELPEGMLPHLVAHAGAWVLLQHYGPPWLLDTRDGSLRELALGLPGDTDLALGLSPAGDELWALEPERRRLLRYALP